jgi:hypothetical protein
MLGAGKAQKRAGNDLTLFHEEKKALINLLLKQFAQVSLTMAGVQ